LTGLIDHVHRQMLRAAYPMLLRYEAWSGRHRPSAVVALWHGGRLLVVRHSYRPGTELPGGALRRGEPPRLGAARELREEVGIEVDPADLTPYATMGREPGVVLKTLFEYRPRRRPIPHIDNREIVDACFVLPDDVEDPTFTLRRYLQDVG